MNQFCHFCSMFGCGLRRALPWRILPGLVALQSWLGNVDHGQGSVCGRAQVTSDALALLSKLLLAAHPEVRAAAIFALSICIQARGCRPLCSLK